MSGSEKRALLLERANGVDVALAKTLLSEAGIPCMVEGPDFDVAELGRAAHDMIRGQNVYVPTSALERSQDVLKEAWGEKALEN